jgi:hypothetical protein
VSPDRTVKSAQRLDRRHHQPPAHRRLPHPQGRPRAQVPLHRHQRLRPVRHQHLHLRHDGPGELPHPRRHQPHLQRQRDDPRRAPRSRARTGCRSAATSTSRA